MTVLRALTRIAINRLGYDIRRVGSPATVRVAEPGTDPITFEYVRERRGYAVFEIPIVDVRAFLSLALPLRSDSHPFVRAVECARREANEELARSSIERILRSYYEEVCPASAAEGLDLSWEEVPGLREFAPDSDDHPIDINFLPWSGWSPDKVREGRRRAAKFEGLQNGVIANVADGVTSFGPVKPAKLSLEVNRLARLVASVNRRGFIRFNPRSPLKVAAFRRADQYKWVINSGQHRFAAAAAFGIESLPAMVTEVVRRDDARLWPQVANGIFTEAGALSIFDRIYDGTPAAVCRAWIEKSPGQGDSNVAG